MSGKCSHVRHTSTLIRCMLHRMRVLDARFGADEAGGGRQCKCDEHGPSMSAGCRRWLQGQWRLISTPVWMSNWTGIHLGKLLPCTHPDELGFVGNQLPPVRCHPSLDSGDTSRKVRHRWWGPFVEIQLIVIGIAVNLEVGLLCDEWYVCCVEDEEKRPENTYLRNNGNDCGDIGRSPSWIYSTFGWITRARLEFEKELVRF